MVTVVAIFGYNSLEVRFRSTELVLGTLVCVVVALVPSLRIGVDNVSPAC